MVPSLQTLSSSSMSWLKEILQSSMSELKLAVTSHLSPPYYRYMHVEAECPFITFDDLLDRLEDLVGRREGVRDVCGDLCLCVQVCDTVDRVLKSPIAALLHEMNPVRV